MNEPIGNEIYGPFLVRFALGGYFFLQGLHKLQDIPGFINTVQSFKLLPPHLGTLYATLIPYLEMGAGLLLVLGIWTTLAGLLASFLLLSYVVALKVFPNPNYLFNKDIILLCASLSLLYSGAGAFSIDRFRKNG